LHSPYISVGKNFNFFINLNNSFGHLEPLAYKISTVKWGDPIHFNKALINNTLKNNTLMISMAFPPIFNAFKSTKINWDVFDFISA
jgi:hypothetical protein